MNAFVQGLLAIITAILPDISTASTIGKIVIELQGLLPIIEQEIADLGQPVKNIIAALSANPAATPDQLAALAALDLQVDAAFDKAAADYTAAHPAT